MVKDIILVLRICLDLFSKAAKKVKTGTIQNCVYIDMMANTNDGYLLRKMVKPGDIKDASEFDQIEFSFFVCLFCFSRYIAHPNEFLPLSSKLINTFSMWIKWLLISK